MHDVRLLVEKFLGPDWTIEADAMRLLEQYDWPGNVRQLNNAIERAKIMADDQTVHSHDLPVEVTGKIQIGAHANGIASDELAAIERAHIVEVLSREGGNKASAARVLGVNRRSLYRLLDKFDIRPEELVDARM